MEDRAMSWVIDVDQDGFERDVIERSHEVPVVVDFWARWCGPCRVLGPLLEDLARERAGAFVLAKVDIDRSPELAERFQVQSVPAVKAFRKGQPTQEFIGLKPVPELRRWMDAIAPDAVELAALEAAGLEASDPAAAEAAYRRVLQQRPRHERASVGLARVLLSRGADDEASGVLGPVAPGTELRDEIDRLEAVLKLRALARAVGATEEALRAGVAQDAASAEALCRLGVVLAASGRYPEALESLLEAARRDKKLGASKVREAMVQVFFALGPRDPLSDRYRSELARTIY
jgi:putative thioredoxin